MRNKILFVLLFAFCSPVANRAAEAPSISIPKAGLALWLRADGAVEENGKVIRITDRSGRSNDAILMQYPGTEVMTPKVVKHEICGQPVLRFDGSATGFSFKTIPDIRSVFWVVSKTPAAFKQKWELFVLGGRETLDFHVGKHFNDAILGPPASTSLREGKLWFNGFSSDPMFTEFPSGNLAVISLFSTGNVSADQIATDRKFLKRWWNGDIAEIMIYTVPLSDQDRQVVERYLQEKYSIKPFRPVIVTAEDLEKAKEANSAYDASKRGS